jgi:hypothetical protein
MSDPDLRQFWKFDDADLAANRSGQLSEKQKTYLTGEHKTQKNTFLGVGGAVVALFLCIPALVLGARVVLPAILSGDSSLTDFLPAGLGLGFVGAVAVPVFAVLAIYLMRANKKADITIKSAGGAAVYSWGTKRVRNPGNSARPYDDVRVLHLSLGDKKFEVHNDLQEIIKQGEMWKIYYTSYPFKFLSGEKIS